MGCYMKNNDKTNQKNNVNLFNAVVVGENPESAFIVEGNRLHAIEQSIAALKKDKSDPKQVIPLMRDALKALIQHAEGKVPAHFTNIDLKEFSEKADEEAQLIKKIENIFTHLPHTDRNQLSSMIHHKQSAK